MMLILLLACCAIIVGGRCRCSRCEPSSASNAQARSLQLEGEALASVLPDPFVGNASALVNPHQEMTTSMGGVIVGVMTCRRFHQTRCQAQANTWLRQARRVVFFSDDSDGAPDELLAPVVSHAFDPSESERVFSGGNWRAVPILRALAERFFSAPAQTLLRSRGEVLPSWIFMVDDDSYVSVPQLLATLAERNPDEPHYLGYAFVAAPHLEGIVPGKRQPLFANGGAGIAVSRAALVAALPVLADCEKTYKWNWPGDVRIAQCLLDAGVNLEWIRTFHAEAPGVIIRKQRPPPGSVPVGLHLPPVSFHHVDPEMLHALDRMQAVRVVIDGLPYEVDFSRFAFQPLTAVDPSTRMQLHMYYGYEVLLAPAVPVDGSTNQMIHTLRLGQFLTSFRAGSAHAVGNVPAAYVHKFMGDECRESGALLGGMSAVVTTFCGQCDAEPWQPKVAESGLRVCNFSFGEVEPCVARVAIAIERNCPVPLPLFRMGFDVGTSPGFADVVRDGSPTPRWASDCFERAAGCAQVSGNLTLHFRVLHGSAEVHWLHAGAERLLLLSGVAEAGAVEPPSQHVHLLMQSRCATLQSTGTLAASATAHAEVRVRGYTPARLRWTWAC